MILTLYVYVWVHGLDRISVINFQYGECVINWNEELIFVSTSNLAKKGWKIIV
jgi:hypothetical protein